MLNANTLSQLTQLKTQLREENPHLSGTVRGSNGKHGFVQLDKDKRSIYLNPDQMQQVLAGDSVEITVKKDDKGREQGHLEALLSSDFKRFTGEVVVKGKNTFVNVDAPNFNRWLFVLPSQAKKLKAGDYVIGELQKHPFGSGKTQIAIKHNIGHKSDAFIERDYALAVHDFNPECSPELTALGANCESIIASEKANREDLSAQCFITIDGENSKDLDDAIALTATASGFLLQVAIADPTSLIPQQKQIEGEIRKRASSLYFPGKAYHMLPSEIAEQHCSLLANVERLALVLKIELNSDYQVQSCDISKAVISSKAQLSYQGVQAILDGQDSDNEQINALVKELAKLQQGLVQQRQQHNLISENRADYDYELDAQGKPLNIQHLPRIMSQKIVEECMLIANLSAANWLKEKGAQAAFTRHDGFKEMRVEQIDRILQSQKLDFKRPDTQQLAGFVEFMQYAQNLAKADDAALPLDRVLAKQLERAELSTSAQPHMALGFSAYAPFTSPLRRYQDFLNHRAVHAVLAGENFSVQQNQLDSLQESVRQGRFAVRLAEASLACQFMAKQDKKAELNATIHHINSRAISVTLDDYGIDGIIETRNFKEKFKFDSTILRLTHQEQSYDLGQAVTVRVSKIDSINRQIFCQLVPAKTADAAAEWASL